MRSSRPLSRILNFASNSRQRASVSSLGPEQAKADTDESDSSQRDPTPDDGKDDANSSAVQNDDTPGARVLHAEVDSRSAMAIRNYKELSALSTLMHNDNAAGANSPLTQCAVRDPRDATTVFGVPIVEATLKSQLDPSLPVPAIVMRCIDYLDAMGLQEVGLYRVPGAASLLTRLRAAFDAGVDINFLFPLGATSSAISGPCTSSPSAATTIANAVGSVFSSRSTSTGPVDYTGISCDSYIGRSGDHHKHSSSSNPFSQSTLTQSEAFLTGSNLSTSSCVDIHAVSSLLKLYFRELPHHVLGSESERAAFHSIHDTAVEMGRDPVPELVELVAGLVESSKMHPAVYTVMSFLCSHLARLAYFGNKNKMTPTNIALVFSPTLRIDVSVLVTLITHGSTIFPLSEPDFDSALTTRLPPIAPSVQSQQESQLRTAKNYMASSPISLTTPQSPTSESFGTNNGISAHTLSRNRQLPPLPCPPRGQKP